MSASWAACVGALVRLAVPAYDSDDEDWDDEEDADFAAEFPCPECGAMLYDDLDHCPHCGYWLTDADRREQNTGGFSRLVRFVAIAMIVVFLATLLLAGAMF